MNIININLVFSRIFSSEKAKKWWFAGEEKKNCFLWGDETFYDVMNKIIGRIKLLILLSWLRELIGKVWEIYCQRVWLLRFIAGKIGINE